MFLLFFPERVAGRANQLDLDHVRPQVGKRCSINDSPGISIVSNLLCTLQRRYYEAMLHLMWLLHLVTAGLDAEHTARIAKANGTIGEFYTDLGVSKVTTTSVS